jgi:DUF971 family protein
MTDPWPRALTVSGQGSGLTISFAAGETYRIAAELLRVESPSAEVKGHGRGQEELQWGKRHVKIIRAEAVGTYAVRLIFSDGHATGIYTWPYLEKLGREQDEIFAVYLSKLEQAGRPRS